MSWKEFFLTTDGYYKKYWGEWERTRLIAYTTACTTQTKKNKLPSITKWMPLPTDKNTSFSKDKMDLITQALKDKANGQSNKGNDNRRRQGVRGKRKQG